MSSRPDLYRLAMNRLAEEGERLSPPPPTAETEARTIDALGAAIAARGRARRQRRLVVGGASAMVVVAIAAVVVLLARRPAPIAVVGSPSGAPAASSIPPPTESKVVEATLEGSISPLVRAVGAPATSRLAAVHPGDRIVPGPTDPAALRLSTGTRVTIGSGAELEVDALAATQVFRLRRGSAELTVAKLGLGERFLVRTDDAEVEVRGTVFRVETSSEPCASSMTWVRVFEGLVVVRAGGTEHAVEPGGVWPVGCESPARLEVRPPPSAPLPRATPPARSATPETTRLVSGRPSATAPATPVPPVDEPRPPPGSAVAAGGKAAPPTASELAEQNRVYGDAVNARQRGATAEALAGFDAFLARYPRAALAESAAVERMRLLSRNDPARSRLAARDYLARWPHGFARDEAAALLDPR